MSVLTYQCDGCGTTTNEQRPVGWRTSSPTGRFDHLRANVPVQSHFCPGCWGVATHAVHSAFFDTSHLRSDTVEMAVIEQSWVATP